MKAAWFLSVTILTASLQAAEIDPFTNRYAPLKDSLSAVNTLTNRLLNEALSEANEKSGCSEKKLYKAMRKRFNNQYQGELASTIIDSEDIPKTKTPSNESIYRDFQWYEAIVQGGTARISDPIADLMKVNGYLIGTDKFEHFLGSGYRYFKKHYIENEPVEEALRIGWKAETGFLGAVTTGVMSYGDLAANFNGMRFWNHVLLKSDDVLGAEHNLGPYVTCENNQWVATEKTIDWSDYIDESFDEAINCSRFKNETLARKVNTRLIELALKDKEGRHYVCPLVPAALDKLKEKYGRLAPFLLNGHGNNPIGVEFFDRLYPEP